MGGRQELPLLRILVQAIMTKLQHPHHHLVGKKEDSELVLRLLYF
jgi:hypothetical protein